MEYRRLGHSGLQVSALSFGSWVTFATQLDDKKAKGFMETAYENGINFFDNAEVYAQGESETIMGKALQDLKWSRDTFILSSKVFWGGELPTQRGLHRKHITEACNAALRRLQVEYLDLYFCHRPDAHTPIEETVFAMNTLIQQGKIFYWGTSEWDAQDIAKAHGIARQYNMVPPTMEQPEYNMFARERVEKEYARLYTDIGLGTTIWSPLASGILTGKYEKNIPTDSRANLPSYGWLREKFASEEGRKKIQKASQLRQVAQDLGISLTQLAIAWCLKNPYVSTVILGASKANQLQENISALPCVKMLTPEIMTSIDHILQNKPAALREY
jgi:voltage-dependent potassium channel beta subunit